MDRSPTDKIWPKDPPFNKAGQFHFTRNEKGRTKTRKGNLRIRSNYGKKDATGPTRKELESARVRLKKDKINHRRRKKKAYCSLSYLSRLRTRWFHEKGIARIKIGRIQISSCRKKGEGPSQWGVSLQQARGKIGMSPT